MRLGRVTTFEAQCTKKLREALCEFIKVRMDLIYPINFVGHDEWMESEYVLNLAGGDVITNEGEVLGEWRVVAYDPEADDEGGRYEFIGGGQAGVMFSEEFAVLDFRVSRGFALSNLSRTITEWHEGTVP